MVGKENKQFCACVLYVDVNVTEKEHNPHCDRYLTNRIRQPGFSGRRIHVQTLILDHGRIQRKAGNMTLGFQQDMFLICFPHAKDTTNK